MRPALATLLLIIIATLSACTPAPVNPPVSMTDTPLPKPPASSTSTSTSQIGATPSSTSTPIPTIIDTATPTPDYAQIRLVHTFAVYQQSSQVILDMGALRGEYYAIGRHTKLPNVQFRCSDNLERKSELTCKGSAIPFGLDIYFILYKSETDEPVYDNILTFTGPIPSPVGVVCEVEPLWESNQGEVGCWAITCYQYNGQRYEYYGGTGDTCSKPWPYEWNYTYP